MVHNTLKDGPIGPKPKNKPNCPFRNPWMVKHYDGWVQTYYDHHKNLFRGDGRNVGNSWATGFWRGFDGLWKGKWDRESKKTNGYAAYRAGYDIGRLVRKEQNDKNAS